MNRRKFTRIAAALTSLFTLPSWAIASIQDLSGNAERLSEKITRLRIGLHNTAALRERNRLDRLSGNDDASVIPPDDENNYWADVIEDRDKFYYRVNGASIGITGQELRMVVSNPSLYYFSTALKLL